MLLFPRTLLATSITAAFYLPVAQAETPETSSVQEMPSIDQCLISDSSSEDMADAPVQVEADMVEAVNGDKAIYTGDVVVTQGNMRISADTVTLYQQDNVVVAEGNVRSYDGKLKTLSDKATTSLDSDVATLENTQYELLCEGGRGDAAVIHRAGKAFYELEDGSLTSCPEGDNSWRLKASSIEVDQEKEEATLYNPRVEIASVPVFYLPYLTVPIGDTRKTGFLYPSVSLDTKNGFGLSVPIYWNLAPNYDLQTDINFMEKRGTQLDAKFRYLTDLGTGSFNTEYLPDDQKYTEKGDRWAVNWSHSGIVQKAWKLDIDYSKVSDDDYFSDLSSDIGNKEDGQLLQSGEASYRSQSWDATITVKDFQVLSDSTSPYRLMPQVEYNYYAPEFYSKLDFDLTSHISRFETDDEDSPSATRVHIEPRVALPLSNTWGSFTAEAKLFNTYYQQNLDDLSSSNDYEESVSRVIPQIRLHSALYLERDTDARQLFGYTQTLEPQLQYLYVPEQDQSAIYSAYDTTKLQLDYDGLFRSTKYSSIDYIAPANQFSYGASSRFFDDDYRERMNISFGQIIYLDTSYNDSVTSDESSSYSAWALDTEFNYDDYLFYRGGFQYDTASTQIQLADSTLEYRYQEGYSQINYRYVSLDYITNSGVFDDDDYDYTDYTNDGISQLGFITSYNAGKNWKISGQYFYDMTEHVDLEWLAGVSYTSDCWYLGFSYSNQLYSWDDEVGVGTPTYEQNLTVNFGIIGFGQTITAGTDTSNSSLGYSRPFYLNN